VNVNWWQEVLQTLSILEWWWIFIILIVTILVGILGATGVAYLILRFVGKDQIRYSEVFNLLSNRIKEPATNQGDIMVREKTSPPESQVIHPLNKRRNIILQRNATTADHSDSSNQVSSMSGGIAQLGPTFRVESNLWAIDLIAELDYNLGIINEFNGRKLLALQNRAWLSHLVSKNKFPVDLEYQLEQVYYDIGLWNNMLWISTEISHQTNFSNKRYQESLNNISERLKKIRQIIK
jgi:hypothetical protein